MPVHFSSEEDIHMVIAPDATLDCVGQEVHPVATYASRE
jgi:hypothetical protein